MKRILIVVVILLVVGFGAFAQSFSFDTFQTGFQSFADAVANTLPFNASVGLNWSDAYIGQLLAVPPHFGVGVTVGATTIPTESISGVLTALNISLPAEVDQFTAYGIPIPAYTVDGRIGGFLLPFDIGVKVGYIPTGFIEQQLGVPIDVDYLLVGADVRFALLQENIILPSISIGAGYTFMKGAVSVPGVFGGNIDITSITPGDGHTYALSLTDPALKFTWATNVIDLKVQVSKSLLIVTPYLGAGASYGISSAGGGVTSTLQMSVDGGPAAAPTQAQIDAITAYLESQSLTADLSSQGFLVQAAANGWSFRAFGGISLNILIVKLDLGAMYNFTSGSYGATLGLRVQL
jgi:hypothetical protein